LVASLFYSLIIGASAVASQAREPKMKRSHLVLLLGLIACAPAPGFDARGDNTPKWSAGWISPAIAAEDISFDNVTATLGGATVTIPHIAINGSSLSKSDLQKLFDGPWSLSSVDTLSKFDATSVVIPELHVDMTAQVAGNDTPLAQSVAYRDFRLDDIKAGKAARASVAGMTAEVKGPVSLGYSVGQVLATDYDFTGLLRIVYAAALPGEAPKQLSGPSTLENLHFNGPDGVEINIGHAAVGAMKARPLVTPLADFLPALTQASVTDKTLSPAQTAKMVTLLADFYDAFGIDGMTMSDISIKVPDPSFQNASIKTFKIGSIANSRFGEFGIEGLEVNAAGGHVKLGRGALLGMDVKPFLSALSASAKSGELSNDAMKSLDWRQIMPRLDAIVVNNLDVDMPQGPSAQSFTLADYEIKLGNYVGAIPTSLHSRLDDLAADTSFLKAQGSELQQLGYKILDLSTATDVVWNENSKSISVNEISAKGANMGSVLLKATLGNVPRELFAGSLAQMQVAGLGVTLGEASLRVENTGLLDKIVARMAAIQKTTPDKLRAQWGTQAALGIPQMLGGSDSAKALGNAVASFIAKPKSLSISVKAKDVTGLGITDLMAGGGVSPAAILNKLDVTASANQ
jgi:hypothetical protein